MKSLKELQIVEKIETSNYVVSIAKKFESEYTEIILESKTEGRHRARHNSIELLNDEGKQIGYKSINENIAKFIIKNFEYLGDTQSFRIYKQDLENGTIKKRGEEIIEPKEVRHSLTNEEENFTANGSKLIYHKSIFEKYAKTGYGSIIRATLTNHQVCASNCQFCSTISRNRKDSITLQEAKDFVDHLYYDQAEYNKKYFPEYNQAYKEKTGSDIRLRGLILSGGGQPNLWPYFSELVEYLSKLDISLGLITNGFPRKVPEEIYEKFEWIRISITPESASPFYPGGRFDKQYMPEIIKNNPDITVGYSYVFGPWTNDGILNRIATSIEENGFEYCRTLTDCNLTRNAQLQAHRDLAEKLYKLNHIDKNGKPTGKIFHQLKYHGDSKEADSIWEDGQCYLQTYNVFWDTTGHEENGFSYCYPCDSVTVLSELDSDGNINSSERKFNSEKWGTVKNTEVQKLYTEKVKAFFDPRKNCTSCLFMKNNKVVKQIIEGEEVEVANNNVQLKHINFP